MAQPVESEMEELTVAGGGEEGDLKILEHLPLLGESWMTSQQ